MCWDLEVLQELSRCDHETEQDSSSLQESDLLVRIIVEVTKIAILSGKDISSKYSKYYSFDQEFSLERL